VALERVMQLQGLMEPLQELELDRVQLVLEMELHQQQREDQVQLRLTAQDKQLDKARGQALLLMQAVELQLLVDKAQVQHKALELVLHQAAALDKGQLALVLQEPQLVVLEVVRLVLLEAVLLQEVDPDSDQLSSPEIYEGI